MNKTAIIVSTLILVYLLFLSRVGAGATQADIHIQLNVREGGTAEFTIEIINLNSTVYEQAKEAKITIETAIIEAINASSVEINFKNETRSIEITCSISDDRVKEDVDKDRMIRVIRVETEWRKFKLPLTQNFSIDFAEPLSARVSTWNKTEKGYIYSSISDFGEVVFEIVGPDSTMNFYVGEDEETVIFELPLSKVDLFINSPYTILIIVIIAIIVATVYRKLRYG